VQVHYDEGVAIHIGPEPCAGAREGVGEASVGECIGQPLSRERVSRVLTHCISWKATRTGAPAQAPEQPGEVRDPGMCRSSLLGNREVSRSTVRRMPPVRIGKARSRSR
jgi:hypothetical protein